MFNELTVNSMRLENRAAKRPESYVDNIEARPADALGNLLEHVDADALGPCGPRKPNLITSVLPLEWSASLQPCSKHSWQERYRGTGNSRICRILSDHSLPPFSKRFTMFNKLARLICTLS